MLRINAQLVSKKKFFTLLGLGLLIILGFAGSLSAQSITQGYKSDQSLQRGMLVATDPNDPSKIEALTTDSLDRILGVVIQKNDSPVTLSSDDRKIFVASSGEFDVLVSDQNGAIKKGDYISISSLEGIGMKTSPAQATVVGRAIEEFKSPSDSSSPAESNNTYNISRIKAAIDIRDNPLAKPDEQSGIPKFLQDAGETIASKPVSSFRLYISAALFLATMGVVGFMLYGGVRSSMIAIGRNPLSKKSISRGLLQVVLVSFLIFITGLFGVYLLLKL